MDLTNTETNQTPFQINSKLEKKFGETIKAILGRQFITSDEFQDLYEGTDFATFTLAPIKVGARLRRYSYYTKYRDQFTIRWRLPSGVKTEIDKIREGLVDYIFYGFVSEDEGRLLQYFIGDLEVFRFCDPRPYQIKPNKKPSDSTLAAYKLTQFPKFFIVKFWRTEQTRKTREVI